MDVVKRFEHKGKRVEICVDPDPQSPTEWDNLGTIVYLENSRYRLGYHGVTREQMDAIRDNPNYISLPVMAYVHSGCAITARENPGYPFNCPWDGGQSGFVYVPVDKVREEYKIKRISKKTRAKVLEVLRAEVETYSQYLQGEVYGYRIINPDDTWGDSCWGFYGLEYCEESAKEAC